ncbi:MAG: glutamate synthase large subunit, partial [Gammaproteobacteria bacterium]|nr:glutamate synthase large subunit [Gammaproteobacteria bacterium]
MYLRPGGLYRPEFEKDNCGFGLIAQMDGEPSHWLIQTAIGALARLTHRGAVAADGKTGDGCGLLMSMPEVFMRRIAAEQGFQLADLFATGLVFLSTDEDQAESSRAHLNAELENEGLVVAAWRDLPIDTAALGNSAKASLPKIQQVFINFVDDGAATRPGKAEGRIGSSDTHQDDFERKLFLARRRAEKRIIENDDEFYIPSLSSKIILYKGLVMPEFLPVFYKDLNEADIASSLCLFHQRFSTNTLPQWRLAQPFRYLAHNGEINTVQGNRNWAIARGSKFRSKKMPELSDAHPFVNLTGSDSMSLD